MLERYVKKLCEFNAPSGMESSVIDYIKSEIESKCESCVIDPLGNLIAFVRGANRAECKVQLDAHVDEVGVIITAINSDGSLCFATVGGINCESLVSKRIIIGDTIGVIQTRPIHLLSGDEKSKMPSKDSLTIDIGAVSAEDALNHVRVGNIGTFYSQCSDFGEGMILSRALDDRVGCAVMMALIAEGIDYDAYFTFSVQEEVGCRGARVDTYTVNPDFAIVLEATTAADIPDVATNQRVCAVNEGVVISFMDSGTLYDRKLFDSAFDTAKRIGIKAQPKSATSGGNDASAIHLTCGGVRTLSLSVPCRYLHSSAGVISLEDAKCQLVLAREMLNVIASGKL